MENQVAYKKMCRPYNDRGTTISNGSTLHQEKRSVYTEILETAGNIKYPKKYFSDLFSALVGSFLSHLSECCGLLLNDSCSQK